MSWAWLIFIPVLAVMVIIHEFGHLLTARAFGMRVNEFGIGFPPRLASFKKFGIVWSINALPIGGFVRILGENGDSKEPDSFGAHPAWQRAIVLASGALMNLVLALILFYIVALNGTTVADGKPGVVSVEPGSPAAAAGLQPGDIFISTDGNAVTQPNDVVLDTTLKANRAIPYVIQRDGQTLTVMLTPRANPPAGQGPLGVGIGIIPPSVIMTGANLPAGLKEGDVVTSANGQPVTTPTSLDRVLQKATTNTVTFSVSRNGQALTIPGIPLVAQVTNIVKDSNADRAGVKAGIVIKSINGAPIATAADYSATLQRDFGQTVALELYAPATNATTTTNLVVGADLPKVGNQLPNVAELVTTHHVDYGIIGSAKEAGDQAVKWTLLIPRTFDALFHGSIKTSSVAGPIGMAQLTGQVVDNGGGILALLTFTAILSINLFVFNLLPIPALDGGRFFFVLIEIVLRGRRIPPEKEGLVHLVGMVVLLVFIALVSWQDIVRIVSGSSFTS